MSIHIPERKILLPDTINSRLKRLTQFNQETSGVLLYTTSENENSLDLKVEYLFMTGAGKKLEVEIEPKRETIVNRFLYKNKDYGRIDWHTHVSGHRRDSLHEISMGDKDYFVKRLKIDPYFIGMILTKDKRYIIKPKGTGEISTNIIPGTPDFFKNEKRLKIILEDCGKELGIHYLEPLITTKKYGVF